jgi:hypothetical protein
MEVAPGAPYILRRRDAGATDAKNFSKAAQAIIKLNYQYFKLRSIIFIDDIISP